MLRNFFSGEPTAIDEQIDSVLLEMQKTTPGTEDYTKLLNHLAKLYELKTGNRRKPISGDTWLMVIGNVVIVGGIAVYENKHVFRTNRALQMLFRVKGQ